MLQQQESMLQPTPLASNEWQPWWGGRGTDVWQMIQAATTGNITVIRQLLKSTPSLINCSYQYYTPLYFAIRENHPELVEYLLRHTSNTGSWPGSLPAIARDRGLEKMAVYVEKLLKDLFHICPEGNRIAAAIRSGELQQVHDMIKRQPAFLKVADEYGNSPIHWAVLTRQLPLISFLLECGADINMKRPDGARPLDLTNGDYYYRSWCRDLPPGAIQQHQVIAGYLIAHGAYYDIGNAAKFGDLSRVTELLDSDPSLLKKAPDYISYYSGYALRNAAGAGHLDTVKLLLERGADPNFPEPGIAPWGGALHAAVASHHRQIAQLLLESGANPNAAVESSGNVMSRAKSANAPAELIDLLAAYGAAQTVELLCYYNNLEELSQAFNANPFLEVPPEALDAAIQEGNQTTIELILRFHPNILKKHSLQKFSNVNLARWLMKNGLNPNTPNWLGVTPLHQAAGNGNIEMAALCLEFGARINAEESDYASTPLGWAARNGHRSMVAFLLQEGADAMAPRNRPWAQPASWAERMGYEDIVLLLLN
ncbi:MAG: ankyrin repeat domain-containing protein [Pseudobacter sp.]|uniref:ankyrin repeat domain-containing protein n=1 Tax=Pseudobacter sp. TaxID=2045420 RepID=UPI003F7F8194